MSADSGTPRAVVTDDRPPSSGPAVDHDWLAQLAETALAALGVTGDAEVAVTLVDTDTITALNREHLGGTGPTDVLSFPIDGPDGPPGPDATGEHLLPWTLGDVVLCPEIAEAQAADHAGTFDDEMALLCVHGILHVLGWDHAAAVEARAMRAEEARVLAIVHRPVATGTEVPT